LTNVTSDQSNIFGVLSDGGYDFSRSSYNISIKVTDEVEGKVLMHKQLNQQTPFVKVPMPFANYQADFDAWVDSNTIQYALDPTTVLCAAHISLGSPYDDLKSSLAIAHSCNAKL